VHNGGVMDVYTPKGVKHRLGLAEARAKHDAEGATPREGPLLTGPDISHERFARRSTQNTE